MQAYFVFSCEIIFISYKQHEKKRFTPVRKRIKRLYLCIKLLFSVQLRRGLFAEYAAKIVNGDCRPAVAQASCAAEILPAEFGFPERRCARFEHFAVNFADIV